MGYTDRPLDAGFDGAYLDIIDAYEYYAGQGRTTAAQEMADFVAAIRTHARDRDPDCYIFPQIRSAWIWQSRPDPPDLALVLSLSTGIKS
ncbi:MAG: hypothetical protein ACE5LU_26855 [Anaerolineae bacterium]